MSIGRSTRKYLDNPLEEVLGSQPDAKDEIILKLTKENERLKEWKESAMSVYPDMQAIGKLLNVKLGDSVHDKIIPGIKKLKEDLKEAFKAGHHLQYELRDRKTTIDEEFESFISRKK